MRKFALFIWLITLTVPAVAEYGDLSPCLRYDRPYHCGGGCCAENRSMCFTRCPNISVLSCEGTECAGYTSWVVIPNSGSDALQFRCNTSTKKCEYRCKAGYYRANPGKGAAMMCLECPDNAMCTAGDAEGNVNCANGYYREVESSVMHPGLVGLVTTYMCTRCPSYNTYTCSNGSCSKTGVGYGRTGPTSMVVTHPNAKSITECYIPQGVYTDDNTGVFQVTSACYYKTTSSVIPIYPAN